MYNESIQNIKSTSTPKSQVTDLCNWLYYDKGPRY